MLLKSPEQNARRMALWLSLTRTLQVSNGQETHVNALGLYNSVPSRFGLPLSELMESRGITKIVAEITLLDPRGIR